MLQDYGAVVSLPDFSTAQDLGQFIGQLYTFSLTIVGILVFVRFLYAGWLYFAAAGNAGKVGNATDIMKNAVIGAVLLFSSYLILYVINPDLVGQSPLPVNLPDSGCTSNCNPNSTRLLLSKLEPATGPAGATITITGAGFDITNTVVKWDGQITSGFVVQTSERIELIVPTDAKPGDHTVSLTDPTLTTPVLPFKVTTGTAAVTKYICNDKKQCVVSDSGTYSTLGDCNKACSPGPEPDGLNCPAGYFNAIIHPDHFDAGSPDTEATISGSGLQDGLLVYLADTSSEYSGAVYLPAKLIDCNTATFIIPAAFLDKPTKPGYELIYYIYRGIESTENPNFISVR